MRILIDVDGVIADFMQSTLMAIRDVTGRKHKKEEVVGWDIFRLCNDAEKRAVIQDYLNQPEFAYNMAPYPDSIPAIRLLAEVHDVVFVTADWRSGRTWVYDRNRWLKRYFGSTLGKRVIHTSHKECVIGDVFIDDKIDNALLWSDYHPEGLAFLWEQPYNRDFPGQERIIHTNDWEVVKEQCLMT